MPSREVYPNAPLVLVAAEVRHPQAGPLSSAQQQKLKGLLAGALPLSKPLTRTGFTASIGAAPPQFSTLPASVSPRFVSREQTTSVTYNQESLVVETTEYAGFEKFLELIQLAVESRLAVGELDGVERVGLRYIDEVRVPFADSIDWGDWLSSSILGPTPWASGIGLDPGPWQGIAAYSGSLNVSEEFSQLALVLRYGVGEGYALDPGGELKRRTPVPGPYFLMDIDSYWESKSGVPPVDSGSLTDVLAGLHTPVRGLFESLITDRLRDEILMQHGH